MLFSSLSYEVTSQVPFLLHALALQRHAPGTRLAWYVGTTPNLLREVEGVAEM